MNRIMKRKANALSLCLAAALLLGLSQCKKQETPITPPTPEETEEGIHITLDVEDGSRHVVIPGTNTAVVNYSFGDKIYVGDGSKYIGTLTNTGSTGGTGSHFEGTILSPSSETLHFYFVGGLETGTLTKGSTTTFNVDISDQSSNLPVLSYGNAPYAKDATSYTCMLENKCALVKVGLLLNTESTVKLINSAEINIKTEASIRFNHGNPTNPLDKINPFTAGSATENITLYSENGTAKWAILLPHNSEVTTSVKIGEKLYNNVTVPEVAENNYKSITYNAFVPSTDFIYNCDYGVFSVSNTTKVMFSLGNLQATTEDLGTTWTWNFATYQYDYIGNAAANNTINGNGTVSENGNGTIDLFGWSTANTYYGISNSTNNDDFSGDFVDWGSLIIGTDVPNTWRTLSDTEWTYLIANRTNAETKRGWATVNGVQGVVILPDNWALPTNSSFNPAFGLESNNTYTSQQWTDMENAGAVFLPAAGKRIVVPASSPEESPTTALSDDIGRNGYYWTKTNNTYYLGFNNSGMAINTGNPLGCSVRLVRDIE